MSEMSKDGGGERGAVVRWLRSKAAMHHEHLDYEETLIAMGIEECATCIERGDHLPTTPEIKHG